MKKGFTLMEVLVVLGILMILAAILTPVISKVRVQSDKVVAISNCRQQLLAQNMYMQDYDDRFPILAGDSKPGWFRHHILPEYFFPQLLTPYISPGTKGLGYQGIIQGGQLPKIFLDPVKPFDPNAGKQYSPYPYSGWGYSLELNRFYPRYMTNGKFLPGLGPIVFEQVYAPSQTVNFVETADFTFPGIPGDAFGESYFDCGINGQGDPPGFCTAGELETVYPSGVPRILNTSFDRSAVNIVGFCDGHVKAMPVELLYESGKYWSTRADGQSDRPY